MIFIRKLERCRSRYITGQLQHLNELHRLCTILMYLSFLMLTNLSLISLSLGRAPPSVGSKSSAIVSPFVWASPISTSSTTCDGIAVRSSVALDNVGFSNLFQDFFAFGVDTVWVSFCTILRLVLFHICTTIHFLQSPSDTQMC